jgi:hypothetical protein
MVESYGLIVRPELRISVPPLVRVIDFCHRAFFAMPCARYLLSLTSGRRLSDSRLSSNPKTCSSTVKNSPANCCFSGYQAEIQSTIYQFRATSESKGFSTNRTNLSSASCQLYSAVTCRLPAKPRVRARSGSRSKFIITSAISGASFAI